MSEPVTAEEIEEWASRYDPSYESHQWLMQCAAALRDRDAGWAVAKSLAEAMGEMLFVIDQWRKGGIRADGCLIAEDDARNSLATYRTALAANGKS